MLISIVTVCRNAASTIEATCRSIDEQSHRDIEHIVIDGQSTDGTLDVLARNTRPYRRVHSGPDRGLYDAMNKGLARATGDIVVFLNADDRYSASGVLEAVHRLFLESQADAVHADIDMVSHDDGPSVLRRWRSGTYAPWKLLLGWQIPHPALFVKRDVLTRLVGFDSSLRIAADYDLILRLVRQPGIRLAYLPLTVVDMAVGGVSTSGLKATWRGYQESAQVLSRHVGVAGYLIAIFKPLGKVPQWILGRRAGKARAANARKERVGDR